MDLTRSAPSAIQFPTRPIQKLERLENWPGYQPTESSFEIAKKLRDFARDELEILMELL